MVASPETSFSGLNERTEHNILSPERIKEEASYKQLRYGIARHDDAIYAQNEMIPRSSEPLQHFDKLAQYSEDLSAEGKEHAQEMAKRFFSNFDPSIDEIAILSSALTRARETANIYLEVAKDQGFDVKIVASDNKEGDVNFIDSESFIKRADSKREVHRGQISNELFESQGGDEIRTLKSLSLDNIEQMLVEFVFHPRNYMDEVQAQYKYKIPAEYQEVWQQARNIIEADNKGGWGQNYLAYSEQLQKLFDTYRESHYLDEETIPHFASVKDMYERNFRNNLRLMARYDDAIDVYETQHPKHKKIRVLGFGHENQMLYFLNKEFEKVGVDKGDVVGFKILKDENGNKHFTACLSEDPENPKEIDFPHSPAKP